MTVLYKIIITLVIRIVRGVVKRATPEIRDALVDYVRGWEKKAAATPSKWDDLLAEAVRGILMIPPVK